MPIKLIVGLSNPGSEYEHTRHNAGAWLVEHIVQHFHENFHIEKKFKAKIVRLEIAGQECVFAIPTTYMNLSGQTVRAIAQFYKLTPAEILIAHDELDFAPGIIRLKQGGGSGGHNGLKDIVAQLNSADFFRLRIGIGHPGNRDDVLDYVLHSPSAQDRELIKSAIDNVLPLTADLVVGNFSKVMQSLHTNNKE